MRHNYQSALGIGLIGLLLLGGCDAFVSSDKRLQQAEEALTTGQLGRASIELRKLVEKEPQNPQARLLLTRLALRAGDISGAAAELERAKHGGAAPAAVHAMTLELALAKGKHAEVLAALEQEPQLAELERSILKGRALLMAGQAGPALQAFDAAAAVDSKSGVAQAGRAEAQIQAGDVAAASQTIDAALVANPGSWEAGLIKARLLLARGEAAAGEAQLRAALESMGSSATIAQILMARSSAFDLALGAHKLDIAQQDVAQLEGLAPEAAVTQLQGARLLLARNDRRGAVTKLQKVVVQAPQLVQARLLLGQTQMEDGNFLQAEEQFQKAADEASGGTQAAKLLAQVRLRRGDAEGARRAIMPALAERNADPELLGVMGAVQASETQGKSTGDSTLEAVRRAFDADPSNPSLRLALAQALLLARRPDESLRLLGSNEPVGDAGQYWGLRLAATSAARGASAAIAELERLTAARPRDVALIHAGAGLLSSQGQHDKAAALLQRSAHLDPKSVSTALARSNVERSRGDITAADRILTEAIAAQPEAPEPRLALANSHLQRQDTDTALATLRAAPNPGDSAILQLGIGRVELARGNLAAGEAAFDRAIALTPGRVETYAQAGNALAQARQYRAALVRFQKASELSPKVAAFLLGQANAHVALGDPAAARESVRLAAQAEPDSIQPIATLIGIELRDGKNDDAVRHAREWQAKHADDSAANLMLAETLARSGKPAEADQVLTALGRSKPSADLALSVHQLRVVHHLTNPAEPLTTWLAAHQQDVRVRSLLAQHHGRVGDWRGAASESEKVIAIRPRDVVTLNNLAVAYQNLKDPRALPTAEKAYGIAGQSPTVGDTLGWILVEQGQLPRALELLQQSAKAMPQHPDVQFHYGVALARSGKPEEARPALEKALELQRDPQARAAIQAQLDQLRGTQ